jgi:hypothetical protein
VGRRYVEQVILRTRFRSVDAGATHAELLAVLRAAQTEVLKEPPRGTLAFSLLNRLRSYFS